MNVTVTYVRPQPGKTVVYLVLADLPDNPIGVQAVWAFEDEEDAGCLAASWTQNRTRAMVIPIMLAPAGTEMTA